jgi:hypothetical protein
MNVPDLRGLARLWALAVVFSAIAGVVKGQPGFLLYGWLAWGVLIFGWLGSVRLTQQWAIRHREVSTGVRQLVVWLGFSWLFIAFVIIFAIGFGPFHFAN